MCAIAAPALARVNTDGTAVANIQPLTNSRAATGARSFADQIDAVIEMRSMVMNRTEPQPAADCADPKAVTRRLAALEELDSFVRGTISGLINAAPSSELSAEASAELAPILFRHQQDMTESLSGLMELPLVRGKSFLAAYVVRLAEQAARP